MEIEVNSLKERTQKALNDQEFEYNEKTLECLVHLRQTFHVDDEAFESELYQLQYRKVDNLVINAQDVRFFEQNFQRELSEKSNFKQSGNTPSKNFSLSNAQFVQKNNYSVSPAGKVLLPGGSYSGTKKQLKALTLGPETLSELDKQTNYTKQAHLQELYNPYKYPQVSATARIRSAENSVPADFLQEVEDFCLHKYENYLYSTRQAKIEALQQRIHTFKQLYAIQLKRVFGLTIEQWHTVPEQSSSAIYAVGRIVGEGEGQLKKGSVLLEVNQRTRFHLNLDKVSDFVLFKNQIVAVEGLCNGSDIDVQRIFHETLLTAASNPNAQREEDRDNGVRDGSSRNAAQSYTVLVASGPYTHSDSISYKPWERLLQQAKQLNPHFLILFGPFLDQNNRLLKEGVIHANGKYWTYEDFFQCMFAERIKAELPNTHAYLIPAPGDLLSAQLPQRPFRGLQSNISSAQSKENYSQQEPAGTLRSISNPGRLEMDDEVRIDCIVSESILRFRENAVVEGRYSGDPLAVVYEQMLHQRQLLPMHPASGVIDLENLSQIRLWEEIDQDGESDIPHLVIAPSLFMPSARLMLSRTLFINPSVVCKGTQGGHFAMINYFRGGVSAEKKVQVEFWDL